MAKKTLGYTELQWTCPNCGGINPGPEKTCVQCGAPQPEDVEFEQVAGAELIKDGAVADRVKVGADIHCPYCGARNPGDALTCSQCGGDLVEGLKRQRGRVLGAYQTEPVRAVSCPHCGAENPGNAKTCSQCGGSMTLQVDEMPAPEARDIPAGAPIKKAKRFPVGLIIVLVLVCIAVSVFAFLSMRTEDVAGTVVGVGWERTVAVEGLVPIEYRDWSDQIPAEAEILSCEQEIRSVESEPQPNSQEVCGTPYSVDTGSGYAEVVQDCEYQVYDDYCSYIVLEWSVVDTISLTGSDYSPKWPTPTLSDGQRLGNSSETYSIFFDTSKGDYTYSLSEYQSFQQFQIGTNWNLEINAFGGVVSVSP